MLGLTIWLNFFVKQRALFLLFMIPYFALAQSITLDEANSRARENYPLIKQRELISKTAGISIENLGKAFLPQASVNGHVTYQSDVTKVELPGAAFKINPSRDQYNVAAELTQLISDGGVIRQQKELQQLNAVVEDQKIEVELYKLRERINQVYLGILLMDAQVKQVGLVKEDLQTGMNQVEAQVANGIAFKSNLNSLKAEVLKADQKLVELKAARKGLVETLGLFLNEELDENIRLETPQPGELQPAGIVRPEMKLFSDQSKLIGQQKNLITARNLPKTSLFIQGGYGKPGLNLLKNQFDLYYIGGIRINWSLGSLYTTRKEMQLVELNRKYIDIQKETFLLNTNTQLKQQQAEIGKLDQLIVADKGIIELRKSITDAAKAQLENGVITASDYLREVNAEDQARESLISHQLLLLQAQITYRTLTGK